jgi:hypothetical protein
MGRSFAAIAVLAAAAPGCSARLPEPPEAPSSPEGLVEVTSPPPAAHVEYVPDRPRDDAVWLDGQWTWDSRWRWQPGGWYAAPPGARFAPWRTFRRADGSLVLAPAGWYDAHGAPLPTPPLLAAATSAHTAPQPETLPEERRRPPQEPPAP